MTPVDVYLMYCAMRAHFGKGDYDFIKYRGKTKISRNSFYKRKDRAFFVKLASKYDTEQEIQDYLLANFVQDPKGWVGNFSDQNYEDWKNRIDDSLERAWYFSTYLRKEDVKEWLGVIDSQHPKLLKEYLGKRIPIEELIFIDCDYPYLDMWNEELKDDFVWNDTYKLINNYGKFLNDNFNSVRKW
jgi:hypothetical protein